jgi:uncharacterized protein (TIGR03066 family)
LHSAVMVCMVLGLVGCSGKDSASNTGGGKKEPAAASNKDKIIGVWEVTKSADAPPGATVEFTKDGKMKMTFAINGKEMSAEGSYTVEGDKVNSVGPDGKKDTATIKKLTESQLVVEDAKGKTDEYKKK